MADKVKVAVRVRPFNRREIELGTRCIVDMDDTQTMLFNPMMAVKESTADSTPVTTSKSIPKSFAFDHCFWSMSDSSPKYSSQEKVFDCLGTDVLERAFEGYNACIFAYGQTGSGKSYSMMGTVEQKGIIPRLCDSLFERIEANTDPGTSFKVEVSYMEIYNERVRDLLDPKGKHNLKVREHNILGPYVDDLSTLAVSSFEDIDNLMHEGNKSRTVAATNMNSESSRSHAVFNIILTQTLTDLQSAVSGEKVSKLSLVDLAGSERAQKTGAVGERLKEGSNINKSLTTLGLVISALADQASGKNKGKFVPYRDSVLTWLLKDNLGGNSKTVMIATLSPSADNYEETLSTLRYADRAKRIVNHAVVNEDPNARIIRELREEVDMLKKMLDQAQSMKSDDLRERLEESEKLMNEMGKTWEEKLKETERIHQERHAVLEKMGISVQTSGIKVEQGRFYLVNLNADPSLNELLVYYLKESRTLVGRPDAPMSQDIQLLGLGIMSEHCVIDIEGTDVLITPLDGARTCVNGKSVTERTKVKHGDRVVWGNNHFFRINCPKANSPLSDVPDTIDYDFAQQELMLQQMGNDPIQEAISHIEKQHEEAKQEALDKQRQMYERQMQLLRNQLMSPSTPSIPYPFESFSKMTPTGNGPASLHPKYQQWARDREKFFHQSLTKLKEEVVKANTLVREAKFLAQELSKDVDFSVTLQIPAANLSPNRKKGAFVSEPAIVIKQKDRINQIWSMEKFENKVFEMRDVYDEFKEKLMTAAEDALVVKREPFSETQENHNLIGVANIFLEVLTYDAKLEYHVPIISQQGEVAGRLHIELSRVPGKSSEKVTEESSDSATGLSDQSGAAAGAGRHNGLSEDESTLTVGSSITCKLVIKEARGLPPALSNFVFCQYTFWSHPDLIVVPPVVEREGSCQTQSVFTFNHNREFVVNVTDEFLEHCGEGALSIEVWGHRSTGFTSIAEWHPNQSHNKSRSIVDRWSELIRKIELWLEIHEMNDAGEFMPVEVSTKNMDVPTGGVYQLRQGHSRRIMVQVKQVHNSGTLPIICESINHVSIGCVTVRSKLQKGLDSYQEEDLARLREKWSEALIKRREYLDEQLQKIMNKEVKSDEDVERERSLIDQWVGLTEESNELLVPAAGTAIPGAPADWEQPRGMEKHIPVIFLDLNAEDMATPSGKDGIQLSAGLNSLLPKEHGAKFYTLPLVKNLDNDVAVLLSWDSSVHDSAHLNLVTPSTERIYMIVKVVVQLSHPATMEVVLRKRISVNIYKRQSVTDKLKRKIGKGASEDLEDRESLARIVTSQNDQGPSDGESYIENYIKGVSADFLTSSGVTYEIVSNIPKASEDLEDRESLARIAASQNDQGPSDGESYIEKYIKGVSAVESILTLDRLRQDVAVKEILAAKGRLLRKATSVPNIHNVILSPPGFVDQIRSDSSQDLGGAGRDGGTLPKHLTESFNMRTVSRMSASDSSNALKDSKDSTPFGIAPVGKVGISPAQTSKLIKPMTTVVEEQTGRHTDNQTERDSEVDSDDNCSNAKSDDVKTFGTSPGGSSEDCLEAQGGREVEGGGGKRAGVSQHSPVQHNKTFTPSMASSGYASQTLSSLTLSSEDSVSCQSVEEHSIDMSAEHSDDLNQADSDSQETVMIASITSDSAASIVDTKANAVNSPVRSETDQTVGLDCTVGILNKSTNLSESIELKSENRFMSEENVTLDDIVPVVEDDHDIIDVGLNLPAELNLLDGNVGEGVENKNVDFTLESKAKNVELDIVNDVENVNIPLDNCPEKLASNFAESDKKYTSDMNVDTSMYEKSCEESVFTKQMIDIDTNKTDLITELNIVDKSPSEAGPLLDLAENSAMNVDKLDANIHVNAHETALAIDSIGDDISSRNSIEHSGTDTVNINAMDNTSNMASDTQGATNVDISEGEGRGSTPDLLKSSVCHQATDEVQEVKRRAERSRSERPVSMIVGSKKDNIDMNGSQGSLASGTGASSLNTSSVAGTEDFGSISSFGSHADFQRIHDNSPLPSWVKVGEPVTVQISQGGSRPGTIQFVGVTEFASGTWVGVELDTADGKNDGSVKGVRYFRCRPHHGVFVRHDKLVQDRKRRGSSRFTAAKLPSSARRSMGNIAAASGHHMGSTASMSSSLYKPTAASSAKQKLEK